MRGEARLELPGPICRLVGGWRDLMAEDGFDEAEIFAEFDATEAGDDDVALDELQELYVLLVKKHMLAPGSKHILNRLNTYASNLDIPLQVSIFLDTNYRCPPLGDHPTSPRISPYLP